MTRPKVSRYPVSSFGPELMAILVKGSRERVEIPCEDQRTMQYLQMRLQMLRGAMGRERHPQYSLVTRARTSRTWDSNVGKDANCVLVVQPNDAQFSAAIKRAGITVTQHERNLLDEVIDSPMTATEDELDPVDPYAKFK
jgi:hypothetical protein